jgi:UDPglucose 6-dehydrogenase
MSEARPSVGISGLGYMGLATGLAFARRGLSVFGFEIRPEVRAELRAGRTPIYEQGLAELLASEVRARRFSVVDTVEEMARNSDAIMLCLPTPRRANGQIDLRPIRAGAEQLGRALRAVAGYRLVVVKSTVVPGTTSGVIRPLLERASGREGSRLGVAANPEFLAEGSMVHDALEPERIVIGTETPRDERILRKIYARFRSPIVRLSPTGAELVKYSANAFLALKVTFANEISRVAERVGEDIDPVMRAVGLDSRIGTKFLAAGPGFGGSCFQKDVQALVRRAAELGERPRVLAALLPSNADQTHHAIRRMEAATGGLRRKTVAILGLAFKAGTDDVRETRALPIVAAALRSGARVRVHDPVALENFRRLWRSTRNGQSPEFSPTIEDAVRGADLAVIQSAWPEYVDPEGPWIPLMRTARILDLRRGFPANHRMGRDFEWSGLGVGVHDGSSATWPSAPPSRTRRRRRSP